MPRYRLTVEYDGTPFVGWQRQNNGPSVQAAVEAAILRCSGQAVTVVAAGRTDAGVHARGQVVHVDLDREWSAFRLSEAVNHHLKPEPVAIVAAEPVDGRFHARFSATGRHYLYRIANRRAPLALDRNRAWEVSPPLDAGLMQLAADRLVGRHDFTSFRASLCQAASPVRTLDRLDVRRRGDEIHVEASARSFLHHQVRNLVGTLMLAGMGKWTADDVTAALEARNRAAAGQTAPAHGLYFMAVDYASAPEDAVLQGPDHEMDAEVE